MKKTTTLLILLSLIFFSTVNLSYAEDELDVDMADSFDFQKFHKEKAKPKLEKTYEKHSKKIEKKQREVKSGIMVKPSNQSVFGSTGQDLSKRYEIRERYSLDRSNKTPYSAFSVIEAMYKQMAKYCPKGWLKEGEWSKPVEQDYFLYYQFKCL